MRTDFPGTLHQVRSTPRFPLRVVARAYPMNGARQSSAGDCAHAKAGMVLYFIAVFLA